MTAPKEVQHPDKIAAHVLKRAGGMQGHLMDPGISHVPENQVRHEEVWYKDVDYLFPADHRIRYHKFNGDSFFKSYRKTKEQSQVRWTRPTDVEAGIRLANHVREAYDPQAGREIEKTKQAIGLVRDLSVEFRQPDIRPMDVQVIAETAAVKLAEAGFIDAQKDSKREIVEKIMKAAHLDSLDRVNSSRSRLILSHAWVDLIKELLVGKVTENKYASIGAKLIREREFERFVLGQTVSHINELISAGSSFEDQRSVIELKAFVRQYLSRDVVKLKPYAKLAAISRFLIMNTGTSEELELLRRYIGDEADMYYGTKPFTLLDRGERVSRLTGIRSDIEEGLVLGELFLHTKTSEREIALQQHRAQGRNSAVEA